MQTTKYNDAGIKSPYAIFQPCAKTAPEAVDPSSLDELQREKIVHVFDQGFDWTGDHAFYCPGCGWRMFPRGKFHRVSNAPKRRRHFAHKSNNPNCSQESVTHFTAKLDLYLSIKRAIEEFRRSPNTPRNERRDTFEILCRTKSSCGDRAPTTWCGEEEFPERVITEEDLLDCTLEGRFDFHFRADVLLLVRSDDNGIPKQIALEIVVTHPCTEEKLKANGLIIDDQGR